MQVFEGDSLLKLCFSEQPSCMRGHNPVKGERKVICNGRCTNLYNADS